MPKRVNARFEDSELAHKWGARLTIIDPTAATSASPLAYEEEQMRNMPRLFVIPIDSHVRVYLGGRTYGIYCGHSLSIEGRPDLMRTRYRDGYAEVYCPHSQEWEPLG